MRNRANDDGRTDLTCHGDQELSLHVLNDEPLYRGFLRCEDAADLRALVDPVFIYSDDQFAELLSDLDAEREGA